MRFLTLLLCLTTLAWAQPYELRGPGGQQLSSRVTPQGRLLISLLAGGKGASVEMEAADWPKFKAAVEQALVKAPKQAEGQWAPLWKQPPWKHFQLEVLAGKEGGTPTCMLRIGSDVPAAPNAFPTMKLPERRFASLRQWLTQTASFF